MVLFASSGVGCAARAIAESAGKPVIVPVAGEPPISMMGLLGFGNPVLGTKVINRIVRALCYFRLTIPAFAEGCLHKDLLEILVLPYIFCQGLNRIADLFPSLLQVARMPIGLTVLEPDRANATD